ncbi:hypothetical protein Pr1d_24480 [Bythopirellula goksoeyrii]|uniref:Uncharacterized protein n=1 Tax=Bythopirellula goksoeyrii TaxID=1400387 RepID=A0A5B9Q809_9BACT|nr:hypothetical protein Pr1d_24480 [Bythopirellula goksoeyrii]
MPESDTSPIAILPQEARWRYLVFCILSRCKAFAGVTAVTMQQILARSLDRGESREPGGMAGWHGVRKKVVLSSAHGSLTARSWCSLNTISASDFGQPARY